jgi:DNA-binding beta-propeller fold protein YncE
MRRVAQSMDRREFLVAAGAVGLAPGAVARQLGGRPLVLVTADLESRVVAFDLARSRILRYIETVGGPKSIETVGGHSAVVAHTTSGAVSLLDTTSLHVRDVIGGLDEPRYTAARADGRLAYVTDAGRGELVTIDIARGRVLDRTTVGRRVRHVSLHPGGGVLWTALGFSAPALAVVDLRRSTSPRLATRVVPPFPAHDVVFTPDGQRAWVSSGSERRLAVYDAHTLRLLFTLPAGEPPQHITFGSGAAYVTSDDEVRVHRLEDGRLLRRTPVAAGSYNVTRGGRQVFTPSLERGTLTVLDTRGRLLAAPTVARAAHDACFVLGD